MEKYQLKKLKSLLSHANDRIPFYRDWFDQNGFLRLPDGRELHPFEVLNEIVTESGDWLVEYQFVQEQSDRFRLLIVPRRALNSDEENHFHTAVLKKLGAEARLQIEWTDNIERNAGGKLHFCRYLGKNGNNWQP